MAIATLTVALQAQIAEFQADFKKAAKSTEDFQKDFEKTATKASAYGNLIARGVEIGIRAFGDLASKALENADAIEDLSKKTGLSMKTIQDFQDIAHETGTTVNDWTTASYNLGKALAKGGDGVIAAVDKLGLSLHDLNRINQDEQFDKVTDALRDMDDQTEATRIGALLFARSWKEVGGGIREDLDKLKDKTREMSDDTVQRLADANKAWERLGRVAVIVSGEIIAATIDVVAQATSSWGNFFKFIASGPGNQFRFDAPGGLTPEQTAFDDAFNRKFLEQARDRTDADAEADRKAAIAADLLAESMKKAKKAAEDYRESVLKLRDEFSGAKLGADVKLMEDAFRLLTNEQRTSIEVQGRVGEAAERLRQEGAKLSPELLTLAVRTKDFSEWLNKVPGQTDRWASSFNTLRDALEKPLVQLQGMDEALAKIDLSKIGNELNFGEQGFDLFENTIDWETQFKKAPEGLKDALIKQVPGIINILGDALTSGASDHKWEEVGAGIGSSIGQAIGGYFGGPAGAALGGQIGGAIGGWIGGMFDATEYEKRARDAALAFKKIMVDELGAIPELLAGRRNTDLTHLGGFAFDPTELEHLRQQFALVGLEIDNALRSRDPKWLREVLDEGYAKTQLLKEAMEEYGFTWENLGAEGRAFQLGDLLSDLKAKTDVLIGAGIDELDVLMKQEAQYESLLLKAIATNTEIPESMRPLLERMQELGLLTDDVTGEFIDLGQVQWSKTLTQGFNDVVGAIDRLTEALTGQSGLTGSLASLRRAGKDTADSIERDFTNIRVPPIKVGVEYVDTGEPRRSPSIPALAEGGIITKRTLALVHPGEAVIPLDRLSSFGVGSGSSTTVIFERDGRKEAEFIVPYLPGEIRRFVSA